MIALIQRVAHAEVTVAGESIGRINRGLLALIGVRPEDGEQNVRRLLERILAYRVFADDRGRMNRCLTEAQGGLLLVPQFTLAADTRKGNRPGFSTAAPPDVAAQHFELLANLAKFRHENTQTGQFGADMQVALINDGPVTFWIEG